MHIVSSMTTAACSFDLLHVLQDIHLVSDAPAQRWVATTNTLSPELIMSITAGFEV